MCVTSSKQPLCQTAIFLGLADSAPFQKQLVNYENKFKKKANNS